MREAIPWKLLSSVLPWKSTMMMSDNSAGNSRGDGSETMEVGVGETAVEAESPVASSVRCNLKTYNPYMLQKNQKTKLNDEEFLDECVNYLEDKAPGYCKSLFNRSVNIHVRFMNAVL